MQQTQKMQVRFLRWEDTLSRKWHPTPVFLPGKFRRSDTTDQLSNLAHTQGRCQNSPAPPLPPREGSWDVYTSTSVSGIDGFSMRCAGPTEWFPQLGRELSGKEMQKLAVRSQPVFTKWKGCETGADNILYVPLKQAKQPSFPRAPHTIKCTSIYPASDAKDFTVFLDMFFGLEFCFVLCMFVLATHSV